MIWSPVVCLKNKEGGKRDTKKRKKSELGERGQEHVCYFQPKHLSIFQGTAEFAGGEFCP